MQPLRRATVDDDGHDSMRGLSRQPGLLDGLESFLGSRQTSCVLVRRLAGQAQVWPSHKHKPSTCRAAAASTTLTTAAHSRGCACRAGNTASSHSYGSVCPTEACCQASAHHTYTATCILSHSPPEPRSHPCTLAVSHGSIPVTASQCDTSCSSSCSSSISCARFPDPITTAFQHTSGSSRSIDCCAHCCRRQWPHPAATVRHDSCAGSGGGPPL